MIFYDALHSRHLRQSYVESILLDLQAWPKLKASAVEARCSKRRARAATGRGVILAGGVVQAPDCSRETRRAGTHDTVYGSVGLATAS